MSLIRISLNSWLSSHHKFIHILILITGVPLGIAHLRITLDFIYPLDSHSIYEWVAIIVGPVSTLPVIILSVFSRRIAGLWLCLGGVIAYLVLFIGDNNWVLFTFGFTVPKLFYGIILLLLKDKNSKNVHTDLNAS